MTMRCDDAQASQERRVSNDVMSTRLMKGALCIGHFSFKIENVMTE